jgi:hypothetical protein
MVVTDHQVQGHMGLIKRFVAEITPALEVDAPRPRPFIAFRRNLELTRLGLPVWLA